VGHRGQSAGGPGVQSAGREVPGSDTCVRARPDLGRYRRARADVYVDLALTRVAEGFPRIKFDPFWFAASNDVNISREELRRVVQIVAAVRKAVGDDVDIGIELHAKFNTPAAIRIGQALEEFDPWFIEEPIGSEDLDALRLIADNLRRPWPRASGW